MPLNPDTPSSDTEQLDPGASQRTIIQASNPWQTIVITLQNANSQSYTQEPDYSRYAPNNEMRVLRPTAGPSSPSLFNIPEASTSPRHDSQPLTAIQHAPANQQSGDGPGSLPTIITQQAPAGSERVHLSQPSVIVRLPSTDQTPAPQGSNNPPSLPSSPEGGGGFGVESPYRDTHSHSSIRSASDDFPSGNRTDLSLPIAQPMGYPPDLTSHNVVFPPTRRRIISLALFKEFASIFLTLFFDWLPRQLYLYFLLRLPSVYFTRLARIFEGAQMSMREIQEAAFQASDLRQDQPLNPSAVKLKSSWEGFIDSLIKEWETFNIISVLLLTAILTILQIEAAGADPFTRTFALFSLICSLVTLLYGCVYTTRFPVMRKAYKSVEWAREAQAVKVQIWWNIWVLLAMPAIWLTWSIVFFIACIMSFVWRTGTAATEPHLILSPRTELGIRVALTALLGLGAVIFGLIFKTLAHFGGSLDDHLSGARDPPSVVYHQGWSDELSNPPPGLQNLYIPPSHALPSSVNVPPPQTSSFHVASPSATYPSVTTPPELVDTTPFSNATKVVNLRFHDRDAYDMPSFLTSRGFMEGAWNQFIVDASSAWDSDVTTRQSGLLVDHRSLRPQDNVARVLARWNKGYFNPRKTMGLLCHEYIDMFPYSPAFAIYLVDATNKLGQPLVITDRFGAVPEGLTRIDIFDQPRKGSLGRRLLGRTSILSSTHHPNPHVGFQSYRDDRSYRSRSRLRPRRMSRGSKAYPRRTSSKGEPLGQSSSERRNTYPLRDSESPPTPCTSYHPTDTSRIISERRASTAYDESPDRNDSYHASTSETGHGSGSKSVPGTATRRPVKLDIRTNLSSSPEFNPLLLVLPQADRQTELVSGERPIANTGLVESPGSIQAVSLESVNESPGLVLASSREGRAPDPPGPHRQE